MSNMETLRKIGEDALATLSYDPKTGQFVRIADTGSRSRIGMIAGSIRKDGYVVISLCRKPTYAHRLAWFFTHGEWPEVIDHIDGDPSNNRISNLRATTQAGNTLNSRQRPVGESGLRGVTLHKKTGLWNARIRINGRQDSLGYFRDKYEAHRAYLAAVAERHGDMAFINRPPAQMPSQAKRFSVAESGKPE